MTIAMLAVYVLAAILFAPRLSTASVWDRIYVASGMAALLIVTACFDLCWIGG